MNEEKKEVEFSFDGVLFAAMACGLVCVYDNRLPFSHNVISWAIYSFIFMLVIVTCITLIKIKADNQKKTRIKFWLYMALSLAVCVGFCWVWQAPLEKDVTGYCDECDRDIALTYDKENNSISGNYIYCEDCYDSYVKYEDELDWLLNEAVFVTETGNRYHKATCQYIHNADEYWIYNDNKAKSLGYTPCKVCFGEDYDWREHLEY